MANNVTFVIQLRDQFSSTATRVKQQFTSLRDKARQTGAEIKKSLSDAMGGTQQGFASLAKTVVTAEIFRRGMTAAMDYQDAIAELSAITGATGSSLQSLSDDSMRLARRFGQDQSVVAKAMTQVASAKSELLKDPRQLAIVTEQALLLSKAAGIEVPDAVRASVGALNQFGEGADQASRFVNVIAAGAKVGASMVDETAEALKNVGSVAAQFKVSFEETNALVQVLAKNEVKGAEAGTALRGTLSKLEKIANGKLAPSKVGIIKSLEMVEKLGMSNTQIIKEFGEENLRTILILRNNIPLVKQWTQELTNTSVATDQANIRSATFSTSISKLGTSIKSFAIKIFTGIEPVLTLLIDGLTFIINLVDGALSAVGAFIGQLAAAIVSLDFSHFDFAAIKDQFLSAFGETSTPQSAAAPTAPVAAAQGTINGQIVVSATPGSQVVSTQAQATGSNMNVGVNMAAAM